MATDIDELVIAPFREAIERGNEAVANAQAAAATGNSESDGMAIAAQAIVREGERALKRLQPLCDRQIEKHGCLFKTGLGKMESLWDKRRELEELLYDFEDFVEVKTFDKTRYADVQATTKAFAIHVLDSIERLRIDGVPISPPAIPVKFPPLPPLPPGMAPKSGPLERSPRHSDGSSRLRDLPPVRVPDILHRDQGRPPADTDVKHFNPQDLSSPVPGTNVVRRSASSPNAGAHQHSPRKLKLMPPPLTIRRHNLPNSACSSPRTDSHNLNGSKLSPMPGLFSPVQSAPLLGVSQPPSRVMNSCPWHSTDGRLSLFTQVSETGEQRSVSPVTTVGSSILEIPEFPLPTGRISTWVHDQASTESTRGFNDALNPEDDAISPTRSRSQAPTETTTMYPDHVPTRLDPSREPFSAASSRPLTVSSLDSHRLSTPSSQGHTAVTSTASSSVKDVPQSAEQPALEPNERSSPTGVNRSTHRPFTLTPEDWTTVISDTTSTVISGRTGTSTIREADCIIGSKSSLHLQGGFCRGAQRFLSEGDEMGIRQGNGYIQGKHAVIAHCTSCSYAHDYKELSRDLHDDPNSSFTSGTVRFRMRFLFKSHLATHRQNKAYYGCLFCAHAGVVVREGDATVFRTTDLLFRHLARHLQPLCDIEGLKVLYGAIASDNPRPHDFDLHLTEPAVTESEIPQMVLKDIARLPVATAKKDNISRYESDKLSSPDMSINPLRFFAGARIIGVLTPARWDGKWTLGWHDGVWGVFPTKFVALETPRKHEMPPLVAGIAGGNGRSVMTRWKFGHKDVSGKDGWLTFGRGETITNVGWLDREHWCWSGTNAAGKMGVFPRTHVHFDDVREDGMQSTRCEKMTVGGRRSTSTSWTVTKLGLFGGVGKAKLPKS